MTITVYLLEAGNAVYDVLTGLHNPAGRTVVTWYTGNSQLPPMTNYSMVNRTYRYMQATPLYWFGYGLSYTKFNYSKFTVSKVILLWICGKHPYHNPEYMKGLLSKWRIYIAW